MAGTTKAKAAEGSEAPAEPQVSQKTYAKFTGMPGLVSERNFTVADFKSVGIEGEGVQDLLFNRGNRFMIDVTDVDPRVMDVLQEDPDITLTTSDNPRPPRITEIPGTEQPFLRGEVGFGTTADTGTVSTAGNGSSTAGTGV